MEICRAYKTELKPTKIQVKQLLDWCKTSNRVFNWALNIKDASYQNNKDLLKEDREKTPTRFDLGKLYTIYQNKEDVNDRVHWDNGFPRTAMEFALEDLENAFTKFFSNCKKGLEDPGYPKYKSNRYPKKLSFRFHYGGSESARNPKGSISSDNIRIPKIGWVKLKEKDYLPTTGDKSIRFVTISCIADRWYVSVTVKEFIDVTPNSEEPIGVDVGLKSLIVTSDGQHYANNKFTQKYERKLRKVNKELSRRKRINENGNLLGEQSKNYKDTKLKLAKIHQKISNSRKTFLHQVTHDIIVNKKPVIVGIENLNVAGMVKNKRLSKAISDASFGTTASMLKYKGEWHGAEVVEVDRFYPSSQLCCECGHQQKMLLNKRVFKCESCDMVKDRDLNASINIKHEAIRLADAR